MSLSVHSLASGSSGNSMLFTDGQTSFLIDAGIGIRKLITFMNEVGVYAGDLNGIFVTHEHSDHTIGALRLARRFNIPLISSEKTLGAMRKHYISLSTIAMEPGEDIALGAINIRSFRTSHDAALPMGYSIEYGDQRVCYATDTGFVTPDLVEEADGADLVVLESNHDVQRLKAGPYPPVIKARILSNYGHLSNPDAAEFLFRLASKEKPVTFWLAHLSAVNNTPELALKESQSRLAPFLGRTVELHVAERDRRSLAWHSTQKPFQLSLSFSQS